MPTTSRRRDFVFQSIKYFLRQDYQNKELLIVDDEQPVELPYTHPQIRRITLPEKLTLGAKRNFCVEAARGDLIMHWDDDDWMAPHRISYQVASLLKTNAEVCGLQRMLFFEPKSRRTWLYEYPDGQRPWLAGGSLLYTKEFWSRSPFPNIQVASDTRFIWEQQIDRRAVLEDPTFYVALIHEENTSPKNHTGPYWKPWSGNIEDIVGKDLEFYFATKKSGFADVLQTPQHASWEYSVIMVVHNGLEMTRLATLQTLRCLRKHNARLVVVDNGSNDGTQVWLQVLAERGDIDLIRSESNLGHGPALELARGQTASPYIVTLDSDAFPLSDDWLPSLRARLNDKVKVTGIRHHRDYVHPSCLMIERATLDRFSLSFLNEKDRPSKLDVAERISVDLKTRGFEISGLERTGAMRRGSASEPVYLGSRYEELVYHQWYTTRAALSGGQQVDDVPQPAIDSSLKELFERFDAEHREITVVMGLRNSENEPHRLRNALTCLRALNIQTLSRERYRIVLVEQDSAPKLEKTVAPYVDNYLFVCNPGPYNRGWAFNIGAMLAAAASGILCLMDADLLVGPNFLTSCLSAMHDRTTAVLPYGEVVYLDAAETERAIASFDQSPLQGVRANEFRGRIFSTSQGGCIWLDSALYREVGGHDERFRGWGREDREFCLRLERRAKIDRLQGRLLHLYHSRPPEDDKWARQNQRLFNELLHSSNRAAAASIGNPDLYKDEVVPVESALSAKRDWENWHTWPAKRIEKIVNDERRKNSSMSMRRRLAAIVSQLGETMLDVGCGPGALWPHLECVRSTFKWIGLDVTEEMLTTAHRLFPQVSCLRGDAGRLPFADDSFEVVLVRHVLEHLPQWLMEKAIAEATRVAKRAVVIDFFVPPQVEGPRSSVRVGENFIETRWTVGDIVAPVSQAGWMVDSQLSICNGSENDRIWVLMPPDEGVRTSPASAGARSAKITIIMPTYLRGHAILRTVRMIQQQTYQDWELIIVDNAGGGDYQFADHRIQVYTHNERASASYARNVGLNYASGDFVCFFDDDDDMFPNYLESLVSAFTVNPQAKMIRCGMIVSNGTTNYSYATPECCLRREFATADWTTRGPAQDQRYFRSIVHKNNWSEDNGDIVVVREALCRANCDAIGGLRSGRY